MVKRFFDWLFLLIAGEPEVHQPRFKYFEVEAAKLEVGDRIYSGYIHYLSEPDVFTGEIRCVTRLGHETTHHVFVDTDKVLVREDNPDYVERGHHHD